MPNYSKSDFNKKRTINTGDEVLTEIEAGATTNKAVKASSTERKRRAASMKTQGKAGCEMRRVNLAITEENYNFVRVLSKISGRSMTQYINYLIDEYRREHPDVYDKAVEVMKAAGMEVDE